MKEWLLEYLVCPTCGESLTRSRSTLNCQACPEHYQIVEGIPVFTEQDEPDGTAPNEEMAEPKTIPAVERAVSEHRATLNVDVGCGTGRNFDLFSGRVVACDLDFASLVAAKRRAETIDADVAVVCCAAEALPFPDDTFGFALSSEVFEHIEPAARTDYVTELERVVMSDGAVAVSAPIETAGGAVVSKFARRLGLLDAMDDPEGDDHPNLTIEIMERHGFVVQGCLDAPAATALRRRDLGPVATLYDAVARLVPAVSTHAVGVKQPVSE